MPKPFDRYDYLKLRDIERCPYVMFSKAAADWHREDDRRMLLIALDRYAVELEKRDDKAGSA